MNKILTVWNWLKSNWSKVIWTILLVLILIVQRQCVLNNKLKQEIKITQDIADRNLDNYIAKLNDSIQSERNQNNQLIQRIRSIVLEKDDIEKRNIDLLDKYREILNINKNISTINSVISAELKIKDSILDSRSFIAYDSDNITLQFDEIKKWDEKNIRAFRGVVDLGIQNDSLRILKSRFDIVQAISLNAAIVNENGSNVLKIMSGSPDVIFTEIENISIINEQLNPVKPEPIQPTVQKRNMFGIGLNNKIYFEQQGRIEPAAFVLYNHKIKNAPFFFNIGFNWSLLEPQKFPQTGVGFVWSPRWMSF